VIGHLLTQVVTYAPISGRTGGGQPTFGAQVSIKARWEAKSTKVVGPDGTERVGSHVCVSEIELPANARVWGPDDNPAVANEGRVIIGQRKAATPSGWTLYEAVF
jgi:hypothetical protein